MKGYLFDTHVHTAESSACGEVAAEGVVARYRSLGYNGIIVTDHVNAYNFSKLGSTYNEQAENWLKGYRTAKAAAATASPSSSAWRYASLITTTTISSTALTRG